MAEPLRVATWHGPFSRKNPGLLLRDLVRGTSDLDAALALIVAERPDVLLVTRIDFDLDGLALNALGDALGRRGLDLPFRHAPRPNSGVWTGLDLDGDGRTGEPEDAVSYGWFAGQRGLAVLSRWPLRVVADATGTPWRDVPAPRADPSWPQFGLPLSSVAHQRLRVSAPVPFDLVVCAAGPPVFDGPEDRNGLRNADEIALWTRLARPAGGGDVPVMLAGLANLDPDRGEGLRDAIATVLDDPGVQDPLSDSHSFVSERTGPLRLSYVLPGRAFRVHDGRVRWSTEPGSGHGMVVLDLDLP